jgi:hypothetical protein
MSDIGTALRLEQFSKRYTGMLAGMLALGCQYIQFHHPIQPDKDVITVRADSLGDRVDLVAPVLTDRI